MPSLLPRSLPRRVTTPLGNALAKTGLTPNAITVLGFCGSIAAAALIARGEFLVGGILMTVAAGFDLMDGLLARATGRVTRFGGVLDSVFDRLSEAAVLGGVAFYFSSQGKREETILAFVAVVGSLLVSYVRARAEAAGLQLRAGLFTRPERVLVLGLGLIVDQVRIALWVLAVLTNLTVLERLVLVWRKTNAEEAGEKATASGKNLDTPS